MASPGNHGCEWTANFRAHPIAFFLAEGWKATNPNLPLSISSHAENYLNRNSLLGSAGGASITYFDCAAEGWLTFDGRPSPWIRACASAHDGSPATAWVQ